MAKGNTQMKVLFVWAYHYRSLLRVAHGSEPLSTVIKVNYFFIDVAHFLFVSRGLGELGKGS